MVVSFLGGLTAGLLSLYAASLGLAVAACMLGLLIGLYSSARADGAAGLSEIETSRPPEPDVQPPEVVTDFLPKHDSD